MKIIQNASVHFAGKLGVSDVKQVKHIITCVLQSVNIIKVRKQNSCWTFT